MLCRKLAINVVYIKYSLFHPLDSTVRGGRTTPPSATPLLLLHRRSSRTQIGQEMYKVGYKLIYSFLSQAIFTRPKLPVQLLQGTPVPNFMKIQQRFSRWCKVRLFKGRQCLTVTRRCARTRIQAQAHGHTHTRARVRTVIRRCALHLSFSNHHTHYMSSQPWC